MPRPPPALADLRAAVKAYEAVVRQYPASAYSDNALWQGANLALLAFERFAEPSDQKTAVRLFEPAPQAVPGELAHRAHRRGAEAVGAGRAGRARSADSPRRGPTPARSRRRRLVGDQVPVAGVASIRTIKRTALPDGIRVSIELDAESGYHVERLEQPRRVFFDLHGTRAVPALQDATLKFPDAIVREIRLGRHPKNVTRIVMDMEGAESYSVFSLYNPFRLVIDFKASATTQPPRRAGASPAPTATPEQPHSGGVAPAPAEPPAKPEPVVSDASDSGAPRQLQGRRLDGGPALDQTRSPPRHGR